ncbi:MAG: Gfo/Idh/MocA family oxidoreductase, partial [Cyclobacteriaceae bacterium]|nr:Gfo/Idh/MocA family oxidoreductase [Cyclobacteriaceae bacterium]
SHELVQLAGDISADIALNRKDDNLMTSIQNFTNGRGFDSVIITAAAPTNDPIELSAEIARKKGKVIMVGAVKMDIPRDPHFYRKELDLRMSCSYGPGRYDVNYEEDGNDYPYAYVRWTEQRNMESFLKLLSSGSINLKPLITHKFDISDAEKAYDIVLGKQKDFHIGILLTYPESSTEHSTNVKIQSNALKEVNVGFIGAGSFAQSYLIPNAKSWGVSLDTVVTSKGITSKNAAEKFGFNTASANADDVIESKDINTIFIAAPHNTHAQYVINGLKSSKNIFVEKPLAMSFEELDVIKEIYQTTPKPLMVGFNRRFAPISKTIKDEFKNMDEPLIMNFRINAGFIPKDHWTQNESLGGGRIIGEMCHFIDLMQYFSNAEPVKVYADCIDTNNSEIKNDDNIAITIKFNDGSVGNLVYLANGDKSMPKENIEVFSGSKIGVIKDFRGGEMYKDGKKYKLKSESKGHKQEVCAFLDSIKNGEESPISFRSICLTTETTFKIIDSLSTGLPQYL